MTVCLTGDVHHTSMETRDQSYMDRTEVEAALAYAEIACSHDVPVTLFVTGKAAVEESDRVARLAATEGVEIGGHNYYAHATVLHKALRGLTGSWHGPRPVQRWEIGRTLDVLDGVGADVTSWRDHAYRQDGNTLDLITERGITHFSDDVGPDEVVREKSGVTVVPINTPPDHDHVLHAFRTPEYVRESDFEGPFGADAYPVEEWCDWVLDHVAERIAEGEPATILAHPACLDLADGLDTFERLCEELSAYDAVPIRAI